MIAILEAQLTGRHIRHAKHGTRGTGKTSGIYEKGCKEREVRKVVFNRDVGDVGDIRNIGKRYIQHN